MARGQERILILVLILTLILIASGLHGSHLVCDESTHPPHHSRGQRLRAAYKVHPVHVDPRGNRRMHVGEIVHQELLERFFSLQIQGLAHEAWCEGLVNRSLWFYTLSYAWG